MWPNYYLLYKRLNNINNNNNNSYNDNNKNNNNNNIGIRTNAVNVKVEERERLAQEGGSVSIVFPYSPTVNSSLPV